VVLVGIPEAAEAFEARSWRVEHRPVAADLVAELDQMNPRPTLVVATADPT